MLRFLFASLIAFVCFVSLIGLACAYFLLSTPRPTNIRGCFETEMYHLKLCPTDPAYVSSREIPHHLKMAFVVSEDGTFYEHHGFDFFELKQSLRKDLKTGQFSRGGSTITQQLAKNLYLNKEKSLFRKLREAMIAYQIEETLNKEEILEKYVNVVELGPNIYGVRQAAKFYFNKQPSELTVAESVWLAILLPNPKKNYISFKIHKLSAFARREMTVLVNRLVSFRKIDQAAGDQAILEMEMMFAPAGNAPAENVPVVKATDTGEKQDIEGKEGESEDDSDSDSDSPWF